ncbi:helix-turn-helix transcriptional regulator [Amycolatopsis sp. Poz14]|uniref:helix-turn-helix domain-containing protein n=1 Tax=Amycolatopsis sp. Poz14 TaxID=1447705 RepID=UPI001EE8A20B|nr:helix-turn-helix transcriptional regulator [Amycolatopsis sp. Poz14]MCG3757360.1 helix-turn-helix transcriptional regulator [Amycolatopsis sp. Poz14]
MAEGRPGLRRAREARSITQEQLAERVRVSERTVRYWESGESAPALHVRTRLAKELGISRAELESHINGDSVPVSRELLPSASALRPGGSSAEDDEASALELSQRVAASDVGNATLCQLEAIVDDVAIAYATTSPSLLAPRIRGYIDYVTRLLDARMTLSEHRRLLVVGGWFSLLSATVNIDLNRTAAARARLRNAHDFAKDAGHDEIRAWGYETEAWHLLTDKDYVGALDLSRQAQAFAPRGSSIEIQASAQEGRALARLGDRREMYTVLSRVATLVSPLKVPDRPEHHYRYDPNKSVAYMATTLAWAGDPAAETFAREIIKRLERQTPDGKWPRRVASANLDLALALISTDRLDEAVGATRSALASGRVVPSNYWRAEEVVDQVEARKMSEARDLRDAYEEMRHSGASR